MKSNSKKISKELENYLKPYLKKYINQELKMASSEHSLSLDVSISSFTNWLSKQDNVIIEKDKLNGVLVRLGVEHFKELIFKSL